MNSITIAGTLGRDAEIRYMPDGKPVVNFSVADNQGKDKDPIWWRCTLWGDRGPKLAEYLTKGQAVTVIGSAQERAYDKDGQTVKAMDIRVSELALQGGRKDAGGIPPHPASAKAAKAPSTVKTPSAWDDDVPF